MVIPIVLKKIAGPLNKSLASQIVSSGATNIRVRLPAMTAERFRVSPNTRIRIRAAVLYIIIYIYNITLRYCITSANDDDKGKRGENRIIHLVCSSAAALQCVHTPTHTRDPRAIILRTYVCARVYFKPRFPGAAGDAG